MDTVKILQVVGFKKSGKTTLVKRWVALAKSRGLRVAVIKHHGHTDPLAVPDQTADSMQFLAEGADASLVSGGGAVQLQLAEDHYPFETLLELSLFSKPDVVLIEGFKQLDYPKVVLIRNEEDCIELNELTSVQQFIDSRTSEEQLDQWFIDYLEAKS